MPLYRDVLGFLVRSLVLDLLIAGAAVGAAGTRTSYDANGDRL